ncbi:MAG: protease pro-enzyme activation domain-containing protein, partial [Jatrophihabitantaceae bacterium]
MQRSRLLGALLAGVLASAVPAVVQQPAAADTSPTTITVFLKAPDPAGLSRLAAAQGLTHAQRLAELSTLVPSPATRAAVTRDLQARGLRVVDQTAWSVTVTGATGTAQALFGTHPSTTTGTSSDRLRAAASPLPRVPDTLASVVSAAFPTDSGPPVFHHHTGALSGGDFRRAYTPATTSASTGSNDSGLTIATMQLANFYEPDARAGDFGQSTRARDLVSYAHAHRLDNPVGGRYQAIAVNGGPRGQDDMTGGDIEVALDQESILSTAPTAHQRAYFAPNTTAGYNNVFARVYHDAIQPGAHIAAMSVSWGGCEAQTGYPEIHTLEPILQSLVAAGVTIFAAAGDAGIYDCGDGRADVDYPASSPSVIGVGGTYLTARSSAPNTGRNWTEPGWS